MIEQNKQKKDKTLFLKKLGIETDLEGRVKIDQTTMKKLKPIPHGNQYKTISVSDSLLMGFRARVNPGGSKTFIYRFRPKDPGQSVQEKQTITIGTWYDNSDPRFKDKIGMTPTVARNLAKDMIIKIAKKEDPYSIVKAKRKGRTFFSVYTDWIEKRVPSSNFKASSRKDYISRFNTYVKLNSKLERHKKLYRLEADAFKLIKSEYKNITKDDYISIHNAVSKNSKTQANRLIEDMRLVEQYAIEIGVLEKRICIFGKKELNKENSRLDKEDPYTVSEMKRYRAAALSLVHEEKTKQQENPNYKQNHRLVPCYSLLAVSNLGGRSKSMILCLEWEQIDFKNKVIRFMDTKNNEPIVLDYDYKFAAILRVMRRHQKTIHAKDKRYKYVFPSLDKKFKCKHINDVRRTHQTIIEKAKLPYKVIHFLRHTWATTVYEATGDVLAVKEMGGWKSLEAVQKYTQVSRQQRRNKLKQIRNYVSSNSHVA
jgi:integrase